MDSLPNPPLTRFDVVMWFLRVQLWVSLFAGVMAVLTAVGYRFTPFASFGFGLIFSLAGPAWFSVILLLLFPRVLASSVLAQTERDTIYHVDELKPLVSRCIGLVLLVGSVGRVALFSITALYSLLSTGSIWGVSLYGSGTMRYLNLAQFVEPALSCLLGFILAFGPAIRDAMRPR